MLFRSYYEEAQTYFRQEDLALAIEFFERAVYYDAGNKDALYVLGRSYQKNGDAETAVETFQKVLELLPGSDRVRDTKRYLRELGVTVE